STKFPPTDLIANDWHGIAFLVRQLDPPMRACHHVGSHVSLRSSATSVDWVPLAHVAATSVADVAEGILPSCKIRTPDLLVQTLRNSHKPLALGSGYPKETIGYSFYYPPKKKVFVDRNAEFFENSLINQEASGSLEDLEIIQKEDTHPSIEMIKKLMNLKVISIPFHELGDLCKAANYKAALLDPESKKWIDAMNVEMQSMKDNEGWDLVDLHPNGKTVGRKWLFKKKTHM
ncbi:retrotransposon protein, putative, ty1-copia subclass, partial [Tanacetum coccineum]